MRIGVNCFLLQPHIGGMKTYFALLFEYLLEQDRSNKYIFFHSPQNQAELDQLGSSRWREHAVAVKSQEEIAQHWKKIDVYFCPFGALWPRPAPLPSVVTVHDIQEMFFPEFFDVQQRYEREMHFPSSTRAADRVVAVSEFTKRTIVQKHGVLPAAIKVAHLAADPCFFNAVPIEGASTIAIPFERFVFFPANRWRHKNHDLLLRALQRLKDREGLTVNAVFTGFDVEDGYPVLAKAQEYGIGQQVHSVGYVSKTELASIYARAEMLVFPSFFEGFGLPVLEAMAAGCPCAVSNATSVPEVAGEDAVYFDPASVEGAAEAVAKLWRNPALRSSLAKSGRQRAKRFSAEVTANAHLEAFQEAAASFSRLRYWRHLHIHEPLHRRRTERTYADLLGQASSLCDSGDVRVRFGSGWHGLEGGDKDWLRWTSGVGEILLESDADVDALVDGEWLSMERPNSIRIELNGRAVQEWRAEQAAGGFQPLPPIRVSLRRGGNTVRLVSANKGLRSPNDPRQLAVAFRNLAFRVRPAGASGDGGGTSVR